MTTDTQLPDHLERLGEALDRAVRADVAHSRRKLRRPRHPRRVAAGVALTAVLVPAAAVAATQLISTGQVAASLPQGTKALIGTNPTCTVVTENVEYHCVLASAPSNEGAPAANPGGGVASFHTTGNTVIVKLKDGRTFLVKALSEAALKHQVAVLLKQAGGGRVSTTSASTPAAPAWQGTVEPTVDATKHVNGGCRALNSTGTEWECYIGQAAVQQKIISQGFLGQYAPNPGVG